LSNGEEGGTSPSGAGLAVRESAPSRKGRRICNIKGVVGGRELYPRGVKVAVIPAGEPSA